MRHALLAVALLACAEHASTTSIEGGGVVVHEIPIGANRQVDLLFVIDSSASMADEQANLGANFPNFVTVLDTIYGGRPDLHIGVVTSDLGAKGTLDAMGGAGIPGCTGNGGDGAMRRIPDLDGAFIRDVQGPYGRETNYQGSLTETFRKLTRVGITGCDVQQPLAAMERALANPANTGFLRADAYLMIVFITDEDDCTFQRGSEMLFGDALGPVPFRCTRYGITCDEGGATPDAMAEPGEKRLCHPSSSPLLAGIGAYHERLRALKDDPAKIFVTAIAGDGDSIVVEPGPAQGPSCQWNQQTATLAVRLRAFAALFEQRNQVETLCQSDLAGALQPLAQLFKMTLGAPCLDGPLLDTDPAPGLQPDCVMTWTTPAGSALVPACADEPTTRPCYYLAEDSASCPLGLHVGTDRSQAPLQATVQRLECVTDR